MRRYINRWTVLCAWTALMGIVWALFTPRGVSVGSFTLLSLTGPILMLGASMLWSTHQPTPSLRQVRVEMEHSGATGRVPR